jgi:hypothetical protein
LRTSVITATCPIVFIVEFHGGKVGWFLQRLHHGVIHNHGDDYNQMVVDLQVLQNQHERLPSADKVAHTSGKARYTTFTSNMALLLLTPQSRSSASSLKPYTAYVISGQSNEDG